MIISTRNPGKGRLIERARKVPYNWNYDATTSEKTIAASIVGPDGISYIVRLNQEDIAAIERAYEKYKDNF